jgi:hypothetical protein
MAHRSRQTPHKSQHTQSAYAHKTSNAKDFAFVAHRRKGSYDGRAVGHEGQSVTKGGQSRSTAVGDFRV